MNVELSGLVKKLEQLEQILAELNVAIEDADLTLARTKLEAHLEDQRR